MPSSSELWGTIYKISYYSTFHKEILSFHAHFPMVTEDWPFAVTINKVIRGLQEFIMKSHQSAATSHSMRNHHHANNHSQRINTLAHFMPIRFHIL